MVSGFKDTGRKALLSIFLASSTLCITAPAAYAQEQNERIQFEADDLSYIPDTKEVTALGNVRLSKDGYELFAHKVIYNETSGLVIASGGVKMVSPNGEKIVAPEITVSNALRDAFIADVRLIMLDGSQVAAKSAVREGNSKITTLNRAVYSPCHVCEDKPGDKPLWQIKAVKVIHDEKKRRLLYKNAYLEFFGVPVFWVPFFSHPDSTRERASGLLPIEIQQRKSLGLIFSLPYHIPINKSQDVTITPIISTNVNPVLAVEYRQNLGFGDYRINVSGTDTGVKDYTTGITGPKEFRGHVFAKGTFQHNKNWRSNVDVNYASDDTYLRLYGFSELDALKSEYQLEGFLGRSYISTKSMAFQGLRVEDVAGLTAFVLPHIQAEFVPNIKPLGGTIYARADALAITRTSGMDTQRLSSSIEWNRHDTLRNGVVIDTQALVRADLYNINDADQPDDPAFGGSDGTTTRYLAHLATELSLPMVKFGANSTKTLQPIVEIVIAPDGGAPIGINNEDSRAFELNNINLFDPDRSSGLDLWEGGSRITYGLKWAYESKNLSFDAMGGQTIRNEARHDIFVQGTGLEGHVSDFVGRVNIQYKNWFNLHQRFRLDRDQLTVKRNEVSAIIGTEKARLNVGYLRLNRDLNFINREDREELRLSSSLNINKNWNIQGSGIGDLTNGLQGIEYGFGLNYSDECFDFGIRFKRHFTSDRDIQPGTSIMFRFKLKNLG